MAGHWLLAARAALTLSLATASLSAVAAPCPREKIDGPVLTRLAIGTGLVIAWQASELTKATFTADPPRWTDPNLNAYDRLGEKLRWTPTQLDKGAATLSDNTLALTVIGVPIIALAGESHGPCLLEDAATIEEAVAVALVVNQGVKFAASRERPFARDLSAEDRAAICQSARDCADLNLSFFSGHSTMGFSIAAAAGAVAAQRGYASATAAYAIGAMGAGVTAYLRVAAGKHYLSDVTVGALVGAGIGYAVPTYLHPLIKKHESQAATTARVLLVPQLGNDLQGVALVGGW